MFINGECPFWESMFILTIWCSECPNEHYANMPRTWYAIHAGMCLLSVSWCPIHAESASPVEGVSLERHHLRRTCILHVHVRSINYEKLGSILMLSVLTCARISRSACCTISLFLAASTHPLTACHTKCLSTCNDDHACAAFIDLSSMQNQRPTIRCFPPKGSITPHKKHADKYQASERGSKKVDTCTW